MSYTVIWTSRFKKDYKFLMKQGLPTGVFGQGKNGPFSTCWQSPAGVRNKRPIRVSRTFFQMLCGHLSGRHGKHIPSCSAS